MTSLQINTECTYVRSRWKCGHGLGVGRQYSPVVTMRKYVALCRVFLRALCHGVLCYGMLPTLHCTVCRVMLALCRVVSCMRHVVPCRVVSCRVVSCRVVSCRVVSCCAVLFTLLTHLLGIDSRDLRGVPSCRHDNTIHYPHTFGFCALPFFKVFQER